MYLYIDIYLFIYALNWRIKTVIWFYFQYHFYKCFRYFILITTPFSPISPDKRVEPADLRDNWILRIAEGQVTIDSLVIDVHV